MHCTGLFTIYFDRLHKVSNTQRRRAPITDPVHVRPEDVWQRSHKKYRSVIIGCMVTQLFYGGTVQTARVANNAYNRAVVVHELEIAGGIQNC